MTEELKPCPLCNRDPEVHFQPEDEFGSWDTHSVSCIQPNEHHVVTVGHTPQQAAELWNNQYRTPDTSAKVDVEDTKALAEFSALAMRDTIGGNVYESVQNSFAHDAAIVRAYPKLLALATRALLQAPRSDTSAVDDSTTARKQAEAYLEGYNDAKREDAQNGGELCGK